MPDSSATDSALVAKLQADATLAALLPDGWWFDEAPPGRTRFGIVSLVDAADVAVFGGRAYEDTLYLVEARILSTAGGDIKAAAARIDVVLEDQPLTVAGYTWMTCHRESRVRLIDVDAQDTTIRWFRRGGQYRLQMSVT